MTGRHITWRPLGCLVAILSLAASSEAVLCSTYTSEVECQGKMVDVGECGWDAKVQKCTPSDKPLPPGAVGIAVVPGTGTLPAESSPTSGDHQAGNDGSGVTSNSTGYNQALQQQPSSNLETSIASICNMAIKSGPCGRELKRWYWDPTLKKCRTHPWKGCSSNRNMFSSRAECLRRARRCLK